MRRRLLVLFYVLFLMPMSWAGEKDTYSFSWLDPDKEVYVLQNRKYRKDSKVYLNLGYGMTTSGAFVDSKAIQGRVGYFFQEELGIEFLYSVNSGSENATAASVRNEGSSGSVPFRRIVDKYYGGMLMWSPFYAKINTFNSIIYVDWFFGLGYGSLTETNNKDEFLTSSSTFSPVTESHSGILWDTGMKFYLTESFEIRLDLTVLHYKATKPVDPLRSSETNKSVWYDNWDVGLGIGYRF